MKRPLDSHTCVWYFPFILHHTKVWFFGGSHDQLQRFCPAGDGRHHVGGLFHRLPRRTLQPIRPKRAHGVQSKRPDSLVLQREDTRPSPSNRGCNRSFRCRHEKSIPQRLLERSFRAGQLAAQPQGRGFGRSSLLARPARSGPRFRQWAFVPSFPGRAVRRTPPSFHLEAPWNPN